MTGPAQPAPSWVAAAVATAATYVYFLLFAQFALLALAERAGQAAHLRSVMAAMGAGGLIGAAAAARLFAAERARAQLMAGFACCAVVAPLATVAGSTAAWTAVAGAVGLGLGALTVVLAASLRAAAGGGALGRCVGVGTGAAYAFCNLPPVFAADPRAQAWIAAAAAAVGALAATRLAAPGRDPLEAPSGPGLARWVVALTALVWMDSAVFYVIQRTPALRAATWEGSGTLLANAAVHLAAGVAAGWLLDRGWRYAPALAGIGLLVAASLMLAGWLPSAGAGWLYVAGVSLYSVALVYVPAALARAGSAALVFGVAGWVGSALGIGMAQDLAQVPVWFAGAALAAVVTALGTRRAAAAGVALLALAAAPRGAAADDPVARGREVYIREGCIHCHSQYVRPHVALDVERWGPATQLDELLAQRPPLPGNRRQGPDLANVGNRRSPEWNRLHLREPRAVSPGSRMPSYAHLFAGVDSDGDALVAYLASLGADTIPERLEQVAGWRPAPGTVADPARARALFLRLCANCHGPEGRGDGPLAARLSVRPPDWPREGARRTPAGPDAALARARLVKFGLPGSPMAGHEYLSYADVVGLAEHVRSCQTDATLPPP